jgi:hypothetical protein
MPRQRHEDEPEAEVTKPVPQEEQAPVPTEPSAPAEPAEPAKPVDVGPDGVR